MSTGTAAFEGLIFRGGYGKMIANIPRGESIMKITICVGSTCHLLGSRKVVDCFKEQVEKHGLQDKVELSGRFCMGRCGEGVCLTIDDETHIVQPENAEAFFEEQVLAKL